MPPPYVKGWLCTHCLGGRLTKMTVRRRSFTLKELYLCEQCRCVFKYALLVEYGLLLYSKHTECVSEERIG